MFDTDTLRPAIIAMALYLGISVMLPKLLKKPTGVKFIDEMVMMLIADGGFRMSGTILIGIIILLTNYINDEY